MPMQKLLHAMVAEERPAAVAKHSGGGQEAAEKSRDPEMAEAAEEVTPLHQARHQAAAARVSMVPATMELGMGGTPVHACQLAHLNTVRACDIPLTVLQHSYRMHVSPLVMCSVLVATCLAMRFERPSCKN